MSTNIVSDISDVGRTVNKAQTEVPTYETVARFRKVAANATPAFLIFSDPCECVLVDIQFKHIPSVNTFHYTTNVYKDTFNDDLSYIEL